MNQTDFSKQLARDEERREELHKATIETLYHQRAFFEDQMQHGERSEARAKRVITLEEIRSNAYEAYLLRCAEANERTAAATERTAQSFEQIAQALARLSGPSQ